VRVTGDGEHAGVRQRYRISQSHLAASAETRTGIHCDRRVGQLAVGQRAADAGRRHTLRVNGIRRGRQLLARLVSTPISNQLVSPFHTPGPKSISTVNNPLVTKTAVLVTGPATAVP